MRSMHRPPVCVCVRGCGGGRARQGTDPNVAVGDVLGAADEKTMRTSGQTKTQLKEWTEEPRGKMDEMFRAS